MNKEVQAEIERVAKQLWDFDYGGCSPTWEQGPNMHSGYLHNAKQVLLGHGLAIIDKMAKEAPVVVVRVGWEERLYYPVIPLEE